MDENQSYLWTLNEIVQINLHLKLIILFLGRPYLIFESK